MSDKQEHRPFAITHKNGDKQDNHMNNLEWVRMSIPVSEGSCYNNGMRSIREIRAYENEAFDKTWFDRSKSNNNPNIETARKRNIDRIRTAYSDVPDNGYTEWESGYWNGVLGALRWVMGEDRDFLDT